MFIPCVAERRFKKVEVSNVMGVSLVTTKELNELETRELKDAIEKLLNMKLIYDEETTEVFLG